MAMARTNGARGSASLGFEDGSDVHITETEFWDHLMRDVYGQRKGGAIILLDAENARKGVAKTSCAVATARLLSIGFGYQLEPEDFVLSGTEYLRRYQEHPGHEQPSVLVLDEFVGAGAGDKRRAMAQQNVDFGRAWQLLRTKRVVTIATLPDWNQADKRLKKLADYRIWCRENPIGEFQSYKITVPFNEGGGEVQTKALNGTDESGARRVGFPNMDRLNCPFYEYISTKKDSLIDADTWDADDQATTDEEGGDGENVEEVKRKEATKMAIALYEPWNDENDKSYPEVAQIIDGYSREWVGNRVREWKRGEHRDLVEDPRPPEQTAEA